MYYTWTNCSLRNPDATIMLVYLFLLSYQILQSETLDISRNIIVRELHDEDITIGDEQVSHNRDIEIHIKTNLSKHGRESILLRSELLDPGEEDLRTQYGYTSLPLFFHAGQSGSMKSWQVHTKFSLPNLLIWLIFIFLGAPELAL